MDKCRICFKQENSLYSLNEIDESRKIRFLEMIISIADIKHVKSEEYNKICHSCRVKATETYDFKILIERSDMILHNLNPNKLVKFSNIMEVKSKLDLKEDVDSKVLLPFNLLKEIGKGGTSTTYNNTIITKMNSGSNKENIELPVQSVLQSIKKEIKHEDFPYSVDLEDCDPEFNVQECCRDYDAEGCSSDFHVDDDEYMPWKSVKKKSKRKRRTNNAVKGNVSNVCIKPVYLKDVRVLYYDPQEREKNKALYKKKYSRKERIDICCYCGKLTNSLKVHQLIHIGERKYKCDLCHKSYFSESYLKKHKEKHSNVRNYKCHMCVATCFSANDLERHMKSHSNVRNFICNVCNKAFKRKPTLTRHIKLHNAGSKNVNCDFCSMTFYTKGALRHHVRVHTGERPFKCEICSQPYSYKRDFNRHCFKKHGVFLNRRPVYVMNEEVLQRERALMHEMLLRKQGLIKNDQPMNPFEGPQSAIAFEQFMQSLENRPIHEDF